MYKSHMEAQARVQVSAESLSGTHPQPNSDQPAASEASGHSAETAVKLPEELACDISSAAAAIGADSTPAPHSAGETAGDASKASGDDDGDRAGSGAGSLAAGSEQLARLSLGQCGGTDGGELRLVTDDAAEALRMFGAAPSPYLRQAQADFQAALRQLVAAANQQRQLNNAVQLVLM